MTRRLISGLIAVALSPVTLDHLNASEPAPVSVSPALQRFLSADDRSVVRYRALRHMEAECEHFASDAWMDVWTEVDGAGTMQYRIVNEGGSDYIRTKIFRGLLDAERTAINSGAPNRAEITPDNYRFEDRGAADGLASLRISPRRKDVLLIDGSIFLRPLDGELVRLEGRLSRTPSFWVRHVDIVRRYERLVGFTMPVGLDSIAHLLFAGRSTFRMTYQYESINGHRVGTPTPKFVALGQP